MTAIPSSRRLLWFGLLAGGLLLAACQRGTQELPGQAAEPAEAVRQLARHLHDNDLVGYARASVSPDQYVQLESAWRRGESRWPLTDLPLSRQLPALLATLSAPGAESSLQRAFRAQFAGQDAAIRQAANSLGLFGVQYLTHQGDYTPTQREHYLQIVAALSRWAAHASLGDSARADAAIARLAAAARRTGLASEDDLQQAGMEESLRRLGPFLAEVKAVLAGYGLDLDHSLAQLRAGVVEQTDEGASVRVQYPLAGSEVDFREPMVRRGRHWYLAQTQQEVVQLQQRGIAPGGVLPGPDGAPEPSGAATDSATGP